MRVVVVALVTLGLMLSGCVAYDAIGQYFEVKNLTGERLTLTHISSRTIFHATSGELIHPPVSKLGCEWSGWVASFDSGTIVAQIPGGCRGYLWTIRGVNDSTYQKIT